jgi:hypothetical protein
VRIFSAHATIAVLAAGLSLGGQASPAMATSYKPTGQYAQFADCPLVVAELEDCIFATVSSGTVTVGHKTIPIGTTITMQGGFYSPNEEIDELAYVGAEDGDTLSSMPVSVPGGLGGLIPAGDLSGPLQTQLKASPSAVTMTLRLARPASDIGLSTENILFEKGAGLRLPLEIKLNNSFLGASCYIGSSSEPVVLSMTTGSTSPPAPNRPIKGKVGPVKFTGTNFISLPGMLFVDNSFSAPAATGCGGINASVVDRVLNTVLGLPSPAGRNTAILGGTFNLASPRAVRASE